MFNRKYECIVSLKNERYIDDLAALGPMLKEQPRFRDPTPRSPRPERYQKRSSFKKHGW